MINTDTPTAPAPTAPDWLDDEPSQLASRQWSAYQRARDAGHMKYVEEAKLFDNYYVGCQWDENVVKALDREMRPHHTINMVLSTLNAVTGRYVGMRQDIDFRATRPPASEQTANSLTKIVKHISDDSHSRWVEKQVFMDGCIQDRGFFDIRLDMTENTKGEIRETSRDPIDVLLDPGAREYDPRTWAEVFTTRWLTPDEIAVNYGEKFKDQFRYMSTASCYGTDSVIFDPETFSRDRQYYSQGSGQYMYQDDWQRVRRLRVVERQYYKFAIRKYFVDIYTGDTAPVPEHWDSERITAIATGLGLEVVARPERRIRWTVTCDQIVLKDGWSPYRRFTVIPFFPYFRRGRPFGIVRNLVSPQDLLNKTSSQELHVVNTTANSGWMIESGTLVNMTMQELAARGAKTGLILEYQRGTKPPEKIQPNQIPTGLSQLSQKATIYFREISGISDAMLGQPGREISGEALARKESSGLAQLDPIFDNLDYTRQLRAEMMLELIQDFYTEPMIMNIVGYGPEGEEQAEEIQLNQEQANGEILNDVMLGEYKVVVSSRPSRDVEDESELQVMLQAREIGVMIPDWAIIERMPLQRRKELADWNRKMTGAAEPTEQEVQMAMMQQELDMRRMMAEIGELEAKTQERIANATKLMTEAEAIGEKERADVLKFGAKLRQDLEADMLSFQQKREELQTRIAVAQSKAQSVNQTAMLQALTKRLDTEARERVETIKAQAAVASARNYGKGYSRK